MLAVETNFVIGVVWESWQILVQLLRLCIQFGVTFVFPEIALAEARAALVARIDRQLIALQHLRQWLNDIARAAEMVSLVGPLSDFAFGHLRFTSRPHFSACFRQLSPLAKGKYFRVLSG